eukprot:gene751-863_t
MKDTIRQLIQQALTQLVNEGVLPEGLTPAIQVENTRDKTHGDFASNIAMMLAKPAGLKPRDLAEKIIAALPADPQVTKAEIAGPGFINFFQNTQALASRLDAALADAKIGVRKAGPAQRVAIDLSAPNLAKEMHVGHLRSTIIGDGVARVLEFLGDDVIRQNHVGDWGTQFGMLMAYLQENPITSNELSDLENFYRAAKKRFDESEEFADRARGLVVKLQAGDAECLELWGRFREISLSHCQEIYELLNVKLTMADVMGESAYNDDLINVVNDLKAKGLLVESNGAQCVFLEEFKTADGDPLPVIIVKADGGYLYATTDLAAVRYRSGVLKADRALYFVDQRQALHFQQVFEVARRAGFVTHPMQMEHMGFGTMNGADGRPFKTRDGGTVKLIDLLNEAQDRAYNLVKEKNPELAEADLRNIARVVGIGAVKYADLSKHRTSDYSFNFELMLNFEGNTAPYLLYAYTRVAGVFRKLGKDFSEVEGQINLEAPHEQELAAKLAQFGEVLNSVGEKGTPHILCTYLYEVAGLFSSFYENCPILTADDEAQKQSRLRLAALAGRTLKQGLELLGLETLERIRYQAPAKKPIPGWLWMAIGLTVGAFVVFLMKLDPGKGDDVKRVKQEQQKATKMAEANKTPPSPTAPVKPKYDFYTLLPESEVIVPPDAVPEKTLPTPQPVPTTPVTPAEAAKIDTARAQAALAGITPPPPPPVATTKAAPVTKFFLQAGSFPKQADADRVRAQIILLGQAVTVESGTVKDATWYRVLVGPFSNREQLTVAQKQLAGAGFSNLLLQQRQSR